MNFESFYLKLGGRRFVMTVAALVGTGVLCWFGHISGESYSITVLGLVGAYVAGNTAQKVQQIKSDAATTP